MAKVDIITPTFNQENFTIKCFQSIRKYTKDYRIIWVDNASTEESRNKVMTEVLNHKDYLTIWFEENKGFVKGTNAGLEQSDADYVVFMNNDTEVTPEWFERLVKPLETNANCMASGPLTSAEGSWQGWMNVKRKEFSDLPDLTNKNHEEVSKILKDKYGDFYMSVQMIAFFCTVFKKRVFQMLGKLDESYGLGFADDDDFCHKIVKTGNKVCFVPSAFVYHHHRTTFKSLFEMNDILRMQKENLNIYKRKHNIK